MFAQLGEIVFQNIYAPQTMSFEGNENVFAEIELINQKPQLQRTGQSLTDLNISVRFHARFCNPKLQLDLLEIYHNAGEVLPLLIGNGINKGDFVIKAYPYTIDEALPDGTVIQATVNLQLKEYISVNKLAQIKAETRKKATAVGVNIKPVTRISTQPPPQNMQLAQLASTAKIQASPIDANVRDYQNNTSARPDLAVKIKNSCKKATDALSKMDDKLDEAGDLQDKFSTLNPVISQLKTAYTALNNLLPSADPGALKDANTYLQATVRTFSTQTNSLMQDVILRK